MGKLIDLGSAKRDDPIYSSGPMVSFKPKLTPSTESSKKNTAGKQPTKKIETELKK